MAGFSIQELTVLLSGVVRRYSRLLRNLSGMADVTMLLRLVESLDFSVANFSG